MILAQYPPATLGEVSHEMRTLAEVLDAILIGDPPRVADLCPRHEPPRMVVLAPMARAQDAAGWAGAGTAALTKQPTQPRQPPWSCGSGQG